MVHELRITNQVMYLGPPVEDVRQSLMMELFSWESIILALPRITHARYQVGNYMRWISLLTLFFEA